MIRRVSPGELDLHLVFVGCHLDLDLQADLVGHAHGDATTLAVELDLTYSVASVSR